MQKKNMGILPNLSACRYFGMNATWGKGRCWMMIWPMDSLSQANDVYNPVTVASALLNSFCLHHLSAWLHHSCALQNTIAAFWVKPRFGLETTSRETRRVALIRHRWPGLPHKINASKKEKRKKGWHLKVRSEEWKRLVQAGKRLKGLHQS